jgi:hypothetical protein
MPIRIIAIRAMLACLLLPALTLRAADDTPAEPPEPAGMWRAELDPPEGLRAKPLQLVLHIRHGREGYLATIDGLGPALRNLKVEGLILVEDVLSFQVPEVSARFAGNFYGSGASTCARIRPRATRASIVSPGFTCDSSISASPPGPVTMA